MPSLTPSSQAAIGVVVASDDGRRDALIAPTGRRGKKSKPGSQQEVQYSTATLLGTLLWPRATPAAAGGVRQGQATASIYQTPIPRRIPAGGATAGAAAAAGGADVSILSPGLDNARSPSSSIGVSACASPMSSANTTQLGTDSDQDTSRVAYDKSGTASPTGSQPPDASYHQFQQHQQQQQQLHHQHQQQAQTLGAAGPLSLSASSPSSSFSSSAGEAAAAPLGGVGPGLSFSHLSLAVRRASTASSASSMATVLESPSSASSSCSSSSSSASTVFSPLANSSVGSLSSPTSSISAAAAATASPFSTTSTGATTTSTGATTTGMASIEIWIQALNTSLLATSGNIMSTSTITKVWGQEECAEPTPAASPAASPSPSPSPSPLPDSPPLSPAAAAAAGVGGGRGRGGRGRGWARGAGSGRGRGRGDAAETACPAAAPAAAGSAAAAAPAAPARPGNRFVGAARQFYCIEWPYALWLTSDDKVSHLGLRIESIILCIQHLRNHSDELERGLLKLAEGLQPKNEKLMPELGELVLARMNGLVVDNTTNYRLYSDIMLEPGRSRTESAQIALAATQAPQVVLTNAGFEKAKAEGLVAELAARQGGLPHIVDPSLDRKFTDAFESWRNAASIPRHPLLSGAVAAAGAAGAAPRVCRHCERAGPGEAWIKDHLSQLRELVWELKESDAGGHGTLFSAGQCLACRRPLLQCLLPPKGEQKAAAAQDAGERRGQRLARMQATPAGAARVEDAGDVDGEVGPPAPFDSTSSPVLTSATSATMIAAGVLQGGFSGLPGVPAARPPGSYPGADAAAAQSRKAVTDAAEEACQKMAAARAADGQVAALRSALAAAEAAACAAHQAAHASLGVFSDATAASNALPLQGAAGAGNVAEASAVAEAAGHTAGVGEGGADGSDTSSHGRSVSSRTTHTTQFVELALGSARAPFDSAAADEDVARLTGSPAVSRASSGRALRAAQPHQRGVPIERARSRQGMRGGGATGGAGGVATRQSAAASRRKSDVGVTQSAAIEAGNRIAQEQAPSVARAQPLRAATMNGLLFAAASGNDEAVAAVGAAGPPGPSRRTPLLNLARAAGPSPQVADPITAAGQAAGAAVVPGPLAIMEWPRPLHVTNLHPTFSRISVEAGSASGLPSAGAGAGATGAVGASEVPLRATPSAQSLLYAAQPAPLQAAILSASLVANPALASSIVGPSPLAHSPEPAAASSDSAFAPPWAPRSNTRRLLEPVAAASAAAIDPRAGLSYMYLPSLLGREAGEGGTAVGARGQRECVTPWSSATFAAASAAAATAAVSAAAAAGAAAAEGISAPSEPGPFSFPYLGSARSPLPGHSLASDLTPASATALRLGQLSVSQPPSQHHRQPGESVSWLSAAVARHISGLGPGTSAGVIGAAAALAPPPVPGPVPTDAVGDSGRGGVEKKQPSAVLATPSKLYRTSMNGAQTPAHVLAASNAGSGRNTGFSRGSPMCEVDLGASWLAQQHELQGVAARTATAEGVLGLNRAGSYQDWRRTGIRISTESIPDPHSRGGSPPLAAHGAHGESFLPPALDLASMRGHGPYDLSPRRVAGTNWGEMSPVLGTAANAAEAAVGAAAMTAAQRFGAHAAARAAAAAPRTATGGSTERGSVAVPPDASSLAPWQSSHGMYLFSDQRSLSPPVSAELHARLAAIAHFEICNADDCRGSEHHGAAPLRAGWDAASVSRSPAPVDWSGAGRRATHRESSIARSIPVLSEEKRRADLSIAIDAAATAPGPASVRLGAITGGVAGIPRPAGPTTQDGFDVTAVPLSRVPWGLPGVPRVPLTRVERGATAVVYPSAERLQVIEHYMRPARPPDPVAEQHSRDSVCWDWLSRARPPARLDAGETKAPGFCESAPSVDARLASAAYAPAAGIVSAHASGADWHPPPASAASTPWSLFMRGMLRPGGGPPPISGPPPVSGPPPISGLTAALAAAHVLFPVAAPAPAPAPMSDSIPIPVPARPQLAGTVRGRDSPSGQSEGVATPPSSAPSDSDSDGSSLSE